MKRTAFFVFMGLVVSCAAISAVTISPLVQVVPGPTLPPQVECMESNNNLDLMKYEGRIFFAFRTAPHHFAGKKTRLYVLSSEDGEKWEYETEQRIGADMREPRFAEINGRLMFYYFEAGKNALSFTPQNVWAMHRNGPADWSEPKKVEPFGSGCVLWRVKVRDGVAYATGYCGGESMYTFGNDAPAVWFMKTEDGYNFTPVGEDSVVVVGGSECAFEFDDKGDLFGVIRNEGGDGKTWGGKVCTAKAGDLGNWECRVTPYKYDSPLMFKHDGELYLIARRNIGGVYDQEKRWIPGQLETAHYLLRYWFTKKRTALYRMDREALDFEVVLDFPSRGDTAFPGLVKLDDDRYLMYNYSSDPEGPDRYWLSGQLHSTQIYSTVIEFE